MKEDKDKGVFCCFSSKNLSTWNLHFKDYKSKLYSSGRRSLSLKLYGKAMKQFFGLMFPAANSDEKEMLSQGEHFSDILRWQSGQCKNLWPATRQGEFIKSQFNKKSRHIFAVLSVLSLDLFLFFFLWW